MSTDTTPTLQQVWQMIRQLSTEDRTHLRKSLEMVSLPFGDPRLSGYVREWILEARAHRNRDKCSVALDH